VAPTPDGAWLIFERDGGVVAISTADGRTRRISTDAGAYTGVQPRFPSMPTR